MPGSLSPRFQSQELGLEIFTRALLYGNDDGETQGVLKMVSGKLLYWNEPEPGAAESCA